MTKALYHNGKLKPAVKQNIQTVIVNTKRRLTELNHQLKRCKMSAISAGQATKLTGNFYQ